MKPKTTALRENEDSPKTSVRALLVRDALSRPVFREARLLAGSGGLGRPLRWIHILEVPHVRGMFRGGELILTTGLGFRDRAEDFRSYVEQLIEGSASGLCLELGTAVREVPEAILELADIYDFPLVVFPEQVRFVDITRDLLPSILSTRRDDEPTTSPEPSPNDPRQWIASLAWEPKAMRWAGGQIAPLLAHDALHRSDLTKTLRAYLDCDRSKQRTAECLFIHRQTLYHRLEQISDILAADLDSPAERLLLQVYLWGKGSPSERG